MKLSVAFPLVTLVWATPIQVCKAVIAGEPIKVWKISCALPGRLIGIVWYCLQSSHTPILNQYLSWQTNYSLWVQSVITVIIVMSPHFNHYKCNLL